MTPAAAPTFHLFPYFPAEIRVHIYILATPPRFVHVREGLAVHYLDFFNRFNEDAFSLTLHPGLAHFAQNWRNCLIPKDDRPDGLPRSLNYMHTYRRPPQSSLEQYGFTSSKPAMQPWTATKYTPAMPLSWLLTEPELAWHFVRKSYHYSRAPIPPLLHTCAESRDALVRHGYCLAFGTRTHGPRTWFHFDRDVLHLHPAQWDYPDDGVYGDLETEAWLMCNSNYNVGQFLPEDLLRVRNLSLFGFGVPSLNARHLCHLLRLFGYGVSVLYLVQRLLDEDIDVDELKELKDCPGRSTEKADEVAPVDYTTLARELIESERHFKKNTSWDPWGCVDCDPLDMTHPGTGVPHIFNSRVDRGVLLSWIARELSFFKMVHGGVTEEKSAYFPAQCRLFADYLAELLGVPRTEDERRANERQFRDSSLYRSRPDPVPGLRDGGSDAPSPKVPSVRIVHLGTGVPLLYLEFERKARAMKLQENERLGVAWNYDRGRFCKRDEPGRYELNT